MNSPELWESFLSLPTGAAQDAWLAAQPAPLPLEFFEKLKTHTDALLLETPQTALQIAEAVCHAASFAATPLASALACWARGNVYIHLAEYTSALTDYTQAIQVYQALPASYPLEIARLQVNMITPLKNLGRYAEALTLADAARNGLQPWGGSPAMATLEMNVGSVYRLLGRYPEALAAYERGRATFAALGNATQVAQMDVNRARTLVCMDRFTEAETLFQAARQVLSALDKRLSVARIDLNLATLLSRQGCHRQALELYQQARAAFTALGDETDAAVADLYRTYDTLALNLLPETLDWAAAAQATFAQRAMPRYAALALANGAVAARKFGRYREALAALDQARAIFSDLAAPLEVARLDLERVGCLQALGETPTAIAVATAAGGVLGDFPFQAAQAQLALAAALLAAGQWDASAAAYTAAAVALQAMPSLAWRAHDGLGQLAQASGRLPAACAHYEQAIACIETAEETLELAEFRAGFLDDKLAVYRRAVEVALALADHEAAFALVERSKTGVWRDALSADAGDRSETESLAELRRQWHWLYQRLTRLEEEPETEANPAQRLEQQRTAAAHWQALRGVEQALMQAHRQGHRALARRAGLSLEAARQRVPAQGVLLDYYCAPEALYVFIIQHADVQAVTLPGTLRDVERLIGRWRFNLDSARLGLLDGRPVLGLAEEANGVLRDLYRLLVAPLRSYLPADAAVWVMPHAELWKVPFAALHDGAHYWVETTPLACLPGLLPAASPQHAPAPTATAPLVVGYSDQGRLTHALYEARAVAAVLGNSTLLLEGDATLARLQAQVSTASLLHLATHGVFRADAPSFSALHLADGSLTAETLETWRLPAVDLVTLSACETGVSLNRGSDLLGLARGFWRAGARRLLVSQWAVDDVSTAELMVYFYREWRAGQSAAHALRLAQIATLQKYRHPFYWAGFMVMEVM
ncbi:MAG TPA: CHAT domain-containing protein [Anaerolineae bacterium]|nr:CHAT domain-containing protein [Anaerolineae bacterium]